MNTALRKMAVSVLAARAASSLTVRLIIQVYREKNYIRLRTEAMSKTVIYFMNVILIQSHRVKTAVKFLFVIYSNDGEPFYFN